MANCSEPLSTHEKDRALAMFIQRVVLFSLMNFWEREIALIGASGFNVNEEGSFKKVADHFLYLQKRWENPETGEGAMRPCNGIDTASPLSTASAYGFEQVVR